MRVHLKSRKPDVGKLRSTGDVAGLVEAAHHSEFVVRREAVRALGELGDARAVGPLIAAMGEQSLGKDATQALANLGNSAVEPLIAALDDSDLSVRWGAADALGLAGDARAVEPLIAHLREDPNLSVISALKKLGDPRAVEPLIAALGDDGYHVRLDAVVALGELGDPRAVEPLIALLGDESHDVRNNAEYALEKMGDAAVEPLIAALKDPNEDVRSKAAHALGNLGDARAIEPLMALLNDESDYVRGATQSALLGLRVPEEQQLLSRFGGGTAIGLILKCLDPTEYHAVDLRPAIEELRSEGASGSNRLAPLIQEFTRCRSEGVVYALQVAKNLELTPLLHETLKEVAGSTAARPGGRGVFAPELVGEGRIAWTDQTHSRAVSLAKEALNGVAG